MRRRLRSNQPKGPKRRRNAERPKKQIRLLHITDLHCRQDSKSDIKLRVRALLEDLQRQNVKIDAVLFTGDLTYHGTRDEFELAEELLLRPILNHAILSKDKLNMVAGNHEVHRASIDDLQEAGLVSTLVETGVASKYRPSNKQCDRLDNFFAFMESYKKIKTTFFYTDIQTIAGLKVGFACLNTAWRAAGDNDLGRLFLTVEQVNEAADQLEQCAIKIALLHHPVEWLHISEQDVVVADLKRRFNIIATGHLHERVSVGETTPNHDCLTLTAPALFGGERKDGYNIYTIDYEDRTVLAMYRIFVRKRSTFDRDTEHAQEGMKTFTLPVTNLVRYSEGIIVQRVVEVADSLQEQIRQELQTFQNVDPPVFVTPKLSRITWDENERRVHPFNGRLIDIPENNAILYGARETGKSVLFKSVVSEVNRTIEEGHSRTASYLNLSVTPARTAIQITDLLEQLKTEYCPAGSPGLTVFVDHITETSLDQLSFFVNAAREQNITLVIAISNDLLFNSLGVIKEFKDFSFYELQHWGPSRIRQFIEKGFSRTGLDINAAYEFVKSSLEETDLPTTPIVVCLYLSVFPFFGNQVSSLSFLRLLETIEQLRLDRPDAPTSYSLYNKREILMRLAVACRRDGSLTIARQNAIQIIDDFFQSRLLPIDVDHFLDELDNSRLVSVRTESVGFSYYVFYDYYLATALHKGVGDLKTTNISLSDILSTGQALALYAGMFRDNEELASAIMRSLESAITINEALDIGDLDQYIKDLALPDENPNVDSAIEAEKKRKVDYEAADRQYEKNKRQHPTLRESLRTLASPKNRVEQLAVELFGFKTFYNVFRNLENIPGDTKIALLKRVLDFHIQSTIDLISFFHQLSDNGDFRAAIAYMVTLGGQKYLSRNIGNQSLQNTIETAIATSRNDLKSLMLICVYADLRLPHYGAYLENYAKQTRSFVGVEMVYQKARYLMLTNEGVTLPDGLISAFKAAYEKRSNLYGTTRSTDFSKGYNKALTEIKREHLVYLDQTGFLQ